jgi:hypothetical protein
MKGIQFRFGKSMVDADARMKKETLHRNTTATTTYAND